MIVLEKWKCVREIKSGQGELECITKVLKKEIQKNRGKYLKQPTEAIS